MALQVYLHFKTLPCLGRNRDSLHTGRDFMAGISSLQHTSLLQVCCSCRSRNHHYSLKPPRGKEDIKYTPHFTANTWLFSYKVFFHGHSSGSVFLYDILIDILHSYVYTRHGHTPTESLFVTTRFRDKDIVSTRKPSFHRHQNQAVVKSREYTLQDSSIKSFSHGWEMTLLAEGSPPFPCWRNNVKKHCAHDLSWFPNISSADLWFYHPAEEREHNTFRFYGSFTLLLVFFTRTFISGDPA